MEETERGKKKESKHLLLFLQEGVVSSSFSLNTIFSLYYLSSSHKYICQQTLPWLYAHAMQIYCGPHTNSSIFLSLGINNSLYRTYDKSCSGNGIARRVHFAQKDCE